MIANLRKGLNALRRAGYTVGTNLSEPKALDFWAVSERKAPKLVSYSAEDVRATTVEGVRRGWGPTAKPRTYVPLSWRGSAKEVLGLLVAAGVNATWAGDEGDCVLLHVEPV